MHKSQYITPNVFAETFPSINTINVALSTSDGTPIYPHSYKVSSYRISDPLVDHQSSKCEDDWIMENEDIKLGPSIIRFPYPVDPGSVSASASSSLSMNEIKVPSSALQQPTASPSFSYRIKLARNFLPQDPSHCLIVIPGNKNFFLDDLTSFVSAKCVKCENPITKPSFNVSLKGYEMDKKNIINVPPISGRLYQMPSDDWHEMLDAWACHVETFHNIEVLVEKGRVPLPKIGSAFISRNYIVLNGNDVVVTSVKLGGKRKTKRGLYMVEIVEALCSKCNNIIGEIIFKDKPTDTPNYNDIAALRLDRYNISFDKIAEDYKIIPFVSSFTGHLACDMLDGVNLRAISIFEISSEKYIMKNNVATTNYPYAIRIRIISWKSSIFGANLMPVDLKYKDEELFKKDNSSDIIKLDDLEKKVNDLTNYLNTSYKEKVRLPKTYPIMKLVYSIVPIINEEIEDENIKIDITSGIDFNTTESHNTMGDTVPIEYLKEIHELRAKEAKENSHQHHHHHHHHHAHDINSKRIIRRKEMAAGIEQIVIPEHKFSEFVLNLEASSKILPQNEGQIKISTPKSLEGWNSKENEKCVWKMGFILLGQ